jgi:DNA-binding NarL/FixJ family response regulator
MARALVAIAATETLAVEQARLVEAVCALERARARLRETDSDEPVTAWRSSARARWSVVDEFDLDGRRYVLACRKAPKTNGPEVLTAREREVLSLAIKGHAPKVIAYELGVAPSTVRVHLTNASRKLDVRTHHALLTKYRNWLLRQPT